ncbi:hypothetical protein C1645_831538 [Glomus cerebriforme]|uniref:Galactose oxidase n=1 Tax=Glomus cerebriforme TaxID=658196 RepID=A0A397SHC3_9GLOM|nr:hypothetical protein C1645_831538 [Glomus cerebriforme]
MVCGQNYIPGPRTGHASVYVGGIIYYMGGYSNESELSSTIAANTESEFFYVDTRSNPLLWVDLKNQGVNLPFTIFPTASIGGVNQDSIFIIGGQHLNETNTNYLYRFDTETNELSVPIVKGKAPPTREGMNSVSYKGKIYIFGGHMGSGYNIILFNNFDILDTINLIWQVGSLINSPVTRTGYTATLVNGVIYYIGGRTQQYTFSPMTEIFQYDILGNTWSLKKATATDITTIPGARVGHSAVLFGGKIFVYGGMYFNSDTSYNLPSKGTIVILDTTDLVWSQRDTDAPKLAFHTATLLNKFMIISFGSILELPNNGNSNNELIYGFDLEDPDLKWYLLPSSNTTTTTTLPTKSPVATSFNTETNQPSSPSRMVIVGASISIVAAVLTICVICSSVYRRMKRNKLKTVES